MCACVGVGLQLGCPCQNLEASWHGPLPRAAGPLWGLSGTEWAWCVLPAFLQICHCPPAAPGPSRPTLFMPNPQQLAQSHNSAFQTPGMKGRPLRLAGEAWRGWGNDPVPTSAHGSVEGWKDVLQLMVSHLAPPLRNRGCRGPPWRGGTSPQFPLLPQVPASFHLGHRWGCPEPKHL